MDGHTLKGKYFTTGLQKLQATVQSPRSGRGSPRGEEGMRATGTNFAFTARSGLTADSNVFQRAMAEQDAAKEEEKVEEPPARSATPPQPQPEPKEESPKASPEEPAQEVAEAAQDSAPEEAESPK